MRLRWKLAVVAGALVAVAIVAYGAWTRSLARDFDTRVARYRAEGRPMSRAALALPAVPAAENAAGPLTEMWSLVTALDGRVEEITSLHDVEPAPLTDAQREEIRRGLGELTPVLAKLHEAVARPRLVLPFDPSASPRLSVRTDPVELARDLLVCEHRAGVATASRTIHSLLDVTARWEVQTRREPYTRRKVREAAFRLMDDELSTGRPIEPSELLAWSERLRLAVSAEWTALGVAFDDERLQIIDVVEKARRNEGLDPRIPAYEGWFGRDRLYVDAVEALDRVESRTLESRDEGSLGVLLKRRQGHHPMYPIFEDYNDYSGIREHLAALKLARIAVHIRHVIETGGARPASLDDLRGMLDADALHDPLTGEPFSIDRTAEGATIVKRPTDSRFVRFAAWLIR